MAGFLGVLLHCDNVGQFSVHVECRVSCYLVTVQDLAFTPSVLVREWAELSYTQCIV